jgi:cobalt/nickel transport system permease protein
MHISEGVLSGQVLAAGAAITIAGLAIGLRKLDNRRIPEVAVLTSAFFVASLVRIPVGPGSMHLTLNGLMGLALGWAAVPAIFVGLTLQALLFQFGGLTTLGVNTAIMAIPAVTAYYICSPILSRQGRSPLSAPIAGFLAGFMGTGMGAVLMALALVASDESFIEMGGLILATNTIAALIEGALTAFILAFLLKVRPEMLDLNNTKENS